jgi:CubicO group peptidase (beta-lactamase class C family)
VRGHGDSSIDTVYESASTSKWVAAAVLLDLVDQGVLALRLDLFPQLPRFSEHRRGECDDTEQQQTGQTVLLANHLP